MKHEYHLSYCNKGDKSQSRRASVAKVFVTLCALTLTFGAHAQTVNPATTSSQTTNNLQIKGVVTDKDGSVVPGVKVSLKSNPKVAVATNARGEFQLSVPASNSALVFSGIGFEPKEVTVRPGVSVYDVTMSDHVKEIEAVVVETGIFKRDKISYTGATSSFTGAELKSVGNSNVLQSLKQLDASFAMVENLAAGSNPNAMPDVELRGQSASTINSVKDTFSSDPNQPLFVLNGVEVTLQRINDLDMNRVASVTILKDAGATAIYGSKGANGVVVVETIKPKAGSYNIYYTGDFSISTPALNEFNLMNSSEKLEFERLAGKYISPSAQYNYDQLYNYRLAEIRRGVDTYWLSEPVQTGFSQAHSMRVSGGSEALSVDVGLKYKADDGVMKGSDRNTWGGNIDLNYRAGKFIVANNLDVSGLDYTNSPYGSFTNWTNASPYYRKYNADGGIDPFLQKKNDFGSVSIPSTITQDIGNPLYNATMLKSESKGSNFVLANSFFLQLDPNRDLQFKAGIDFSKTFDNSYNFVDPSDTRYYASPSVQKGYFSNTDIRQNYIRGYINGSYGHKFGRHSITVMLRGEIAQSKNIMIGLEAWGFPLGSKPAPSLANTYVDNSRPDYANVTRRAVNLLTSVNYNYDQRYLFDFTFRDDGASTFGANKLFKPFWSAGIGWNIYKENFAKDWKWLNLLKLRASTGSTGNQNIGTIYSKTVYKLYVMGNEFGQGYYIDKFGSPNIPWQVKHDLSAGIDFKAWQRVAFYFNAYRNMTDPMIVSMGLAPSTGLLSQPYNVGKMETRGFETQLTVTPIYIPEQRIMWNIIFNGASSKSTYHGLGSKLSSLNQDLIAQKSLEMFADGYSPTDIWAVRSYGIDPANGQEVFIKKNGDLTYTYDPNDRVVVGNSRPKMQGIIGTNLRYKEFYVSLGLRYAFGGSTYNYALFNKVENITLAALENNQDKRALYDRWQKPGDVASFKSIAIVAGESQKTSRFVQKNNYMRGESMSVSWEKNNNQWLKHNLGIQTLKLSFYMEDFFRAETSKIERGTDYPFARSYSLSLNVSF